MSKFIPDFEPKGIVKPNLITIVGLYILAGILVISCPVICSYLSDYITDGQGLLILTFIGGAVLCSDCFTSVKDFLLLGRRWDNYSSAHAKAQKLQI